MRIRCDILEYFGLWSVNNYIVQPLSKKSIQSTMGFLLRFSSGTLKKLTIIFSIVYLIHFFLLMSQPYNIYHLSQANNLTSITAKNDIKKQQKGNKKSAPCQSKSMNPYLSQNIWDLVVDNQTVFYTKAKDAIKVLDGLDSPVKLILDSDKQNGSINFYVLLEKILTHNNLIHLYMQNIHFMHPKLKPLPKGLFFDDKCDMQYKNYESVAKSGDNVKQLFTSNAMKNTVWVRHYKDIETKYTKNNKALQTLQSDVCLVLKHHAPKSTVCAENVKKVDISNLRRHSFVACPHKVFFDDFCIWATLLTGAIPIVPHSPIDSMFRELPVWLIDRWEDVTDSSMRNMHSMMLARNNSFNWDKIFVQGWKQEILESQANSSMEMMQMMEMVQPQTFTSRNTISQLKNNISPQNLSFGEYYLHSSKPYLSADVWSEIVDNEVSFFVRPYEEGYPTKNEWISWLDNRSRPATIVMNNNIAKPWPESKNSFDLEVLNHHNLKYLYVKNPTVINKKVKPLPCGLKYQYRSKRLYGESKYRTNLFYDSIARSSSESEFLFRFVNRTTTVFIRPMSVYKSSDVKYERGNNALQTQREDICSILEKNAKNSTYCSFNKKKKLPRKDLFALMKKHRFVASPAGMGLDTHFTWEGNILHDILNFGSSTYVHNFYTNHMNF